MKGNVENGARGIGNKVEVFLVNLLPTVLITHNIGTGDEITIEDLEDRTLVVTVKHPEEAEQA